jgi:phosphatidylserine/phosphatidylglycerophosphate/cardiolipin synthase-like enzyme
VRAWFPRVTAHSLAIVVSVLTYVLTTRVERERRPPSIAIAWVLGLIALPYFALPMYLLFGRRKLPRRTSGWSGRRLHAGHWAEDLIESFGLPPAGPSQVRFHRDGGESRDALIATLNGAAGRLDVCTYILGDDTIGREVTALLTESVRRGVRVRLLLDGVGALQLPHGWARRLNAVGIETAIFSPLLARKTQGPRNLRNHRKWAVADCARLWAGGRNLADEYFIGRKGAPPWLDLSFELEGPAAAAAAQQFEADWEAAGGVAAEPPASAAPGRYRARTAHRCVFSGDPPHDRGDAVLRARCQSRNRHASGGAARRPDRSVHSGEIESHPRRLRAQSLTARTHQGRRRRAPAALHESRQGRGVRRQHCTVRFVQSRLTQPAALWRDLGEGLLLTVAYQL